MGAWFRDTTAAAQIFESVARGPAKWLWVINRMLVDLRVWERAVMAARMDHYK